MTLKLLHLTSTPLQNKSIKINASLKVSPFNLEKIANSGAKDKFNLFIIYLNVPNCVLCIVCLTCALYSVGQANKVIQKDRNWIFNMKLLGSSKCNAWKISAYWVKKKPLVPRIYFNK